MQLIALGLAQLLGSENLLATTDVVNTHPLAPRAPHFPAKAQRVSIEVHRFCQLHAAERQRYRIPSCVEYKGVDDAGSLCTTPRTGGRHIVIWPPSHVVEVGVESVKTFLKK